MLKRNLIANYVGQVWAAIMALAFVPVYIRYLGIEAYGLIGLFSVLQAWLVLLDMGMTPTLSREMSRFKGGAKSAQFIRDLLRSIEVIVVIMACLIALVIAAYSDWLATNWLNVDSLPEQAAADAFTLMGIVTSLRFATSVYRSSLVGLQNQVTLNLIIVVSSTFSALGAIAVLAFYSPTLTAFFCWQGLVAFFTFLALMKATYASLEADGLRGKFSLSALSGVGVYAGGVLGITFLSLLLTQIDKILLSRLLVLTDYGYYTLAALVAGGLYFLLTPIVLAWFPRLSELHAADKSDQFNHLFHRGAQLVSVVLGSVALVVILYADTILLIWTRDPEIVSQSTSLVRWLVLGNLLNGFMTIPYQAQLAYGWTGYAIRVNTISLVLIVPALFWAVPIYGAIGAAVIWVCLNAGYVLLGAQYMYSRMMKAEKWRWYLDDLLKPMACAIATALIFYASMPDFLSPWTQALEIVLALMLAFLAAVCGAPGVRRWLVDQLRIHLGKMR